MRPSSSPLRRLLPCGALQLYTREGSDVRLARGYASRISGWNRERKLRLFMQTLRLTSTSRVLDVGYRDHEYGPHENYLEQHYPWPSQLTALGIEEPVECPKRYPEVTFVCYDGMRFPFEDAHFDVAYSNAVIEHVGGRDRQLLFLSELTRVASSVWMTTPSRGFPIDTHTLIPLAHWLPKRARDAVYARSGKSWATGDYINLLYKRDLERLVVDSGATHYRIIANRFALWPLDYVVVVDRRGAAG